MGMAGVGAVVRTQEEIDEQLNLAMEQSEQGKSKFPGMSYEEGVSEALQWVTGRQEQRPMVDE